MVGKNVTDILLFVMNDRVCPQRSIFPAASTWRKERVQASEWKHQDPEAS